jgi:hypothetical protein
LALCLALPVLAGCGQSPLDESSALRPRISRPASSARESDVRRDALLRVSRRVADRDDGGAGAGLMPSGLHADPDPRIRLYALEAWALNPGPSLDPVTHALVDPDEAVRARAQEVLEEVLVRR